MWNLTPELQARLEKIKQETQQLQKLLGNEKITQSNVKVRTLRPLPKLKV
jgi:hypothetical protein